MSNQRLSEIADIQSGLVLGRKAAKLDSETIYKYKQLNLRSVNDDGSVSINTLSEYFSGQKLDEQFITKENEIVMRLFPPLCPVMITNALTGLVVPSQFAIIRVKSKEVSVAYLWCYLSRYSVLNEMAVMDSGQAVRGIKIATLSNIEIPRVSLINQEAVSSLAETHLKRKKLYLSLLDQYDIQVDIAIKRIIGGEPL